MLNITDQVLNAVYSDSLNYYKATICLSARATFAHRLQWR